MPHAFTCACAHPLTAWLLSPHYAPGTVRELRQHRPERGPSRETAPNSGRVGRRSAGAKREPSKRHPVGVAGVLPLVPFHFPPSVTESPTAVCPTSTLTIQSRSPGVQGWGGLREGRRLTESRWSERPSHRKGQGAQRASAVPQPALQTGHCQSPGGGGWTETAFVCSGCGNKAPGTGRPEQRKSLPHRPGGRSPRSRGQRPAEAASPGPPAVVPLRPSVPARRLLQGRVTWAVGPPR